MCACVRVRVWVTVVAITRFDFALAFGRFVNGQPFQNGGRSNILKCNVLNGLLFFKPVARNEIFTKKLHTAKF